MNDFIRKIDTAIKWSFYVIFFMVPLMMWPDTFELFEFNKMWLVFGWSIVIAFLWGVKIIVQRRIVVRRTPLDIPLLLFLLSQIISTIFSMEPHTSFWGYYSRFNGGLLSTIAYIFLYYAFASNLILEKGEHESEKSPISYPLLVVSLLSGFAVTLWGLPSHFGSDLTCLVFRGTLDTTCWTKDFAPTVRMFSTLGQPNWFGTFLAALIPIAIGAGLIKFAENKLYAASCFLLVFLFYLGLIFSRSQSSFLGFAAGLIFFFAAVIFKNFKQLKQKFATNSFAQYLTVIILIFAIVTFFAGTGVETIDKYASLSGIASHFSQGANKTQTSVPKPQGLEASNDIQLNSVGGTESSRIRLIVWKGALEIFKSHPLFGTGVETYAFAYYQVKPKEHNLTSEWDFLYNKAHNEYLNYLATTGIFGFGTYMSIIIVFLFYFVRQLKKNENKNFPVAIGVVGGWVAILVSNFFGFSVVIVNLFFFLFPLFVFDLSNQKLLSKTFAFPKKENEAHEISSAGWVFIAVLLLIAGYYEFFLFNFWQADKAYSLGYNLNHAGQYAQAYQYLSRANQTLPQEDLYKDELSINMATIALLLFEQKDSTRAAAFANQALTLSNQINAAHPNNIVFLKTRARVAFAISDLDPNGLDLAINTLKRAEQLAPTDAKIAYNEGIFYKQKNDFGDAVQNFNKAIYLKPNYTDAYYAMALLYSDESKKPGPNALAYKQMAIDILNTILTKVDPNNKPAKDLQKSL